jgi:Phosphotransferase enzyme family
MMESKTNTCDISKSNLRKVDQRRTTPTLTHNNLGALDSGSDTETESPVVRKRRGLSVSSQYSNTGATKGSMPKEWAYLKEADEGEDPWALWNMNETFFRNHYSAVAPPERWISLQDFLDHETTSGKVTDCGKYLQELPSKVQAIEQEASALRHGIPCRLDMKHFNKGAFNIVLKVIFDDEVMWVIRIQIPEVLLFNATQRAAHEETQRKALYSQLGSMQYVRRMTSIPVPEIHGHDFSNHNVAGAPYMFMTLVEGMSIKKWLEENTFTKEKALEFYTDLAEIMWEFYRTRFNKIGELEFDHDGTVTVGGFYDSRTHSAYGPFTSAHEFLTQRQQKLWEYRVLAEQQKTAVIPAGSRHWNQLSRDVKDVFIAWLYRRVAPYAQTEYDAAYNNISGDLDDLSLDRKPDYILFHADLSINNILVNDDLKIIAVIDWDWTASLPKSSFDPLPFDMGYETADQFPGSLRDHDVFDHKELFYSIWSRLEMEKDPKGEFGRSLIPARMGKDSIATILNRYAWTYCIERTCKEVFDRLREYEGEDSTCWCCLIEAFRKDWESTKGSKPSWMWNLLSRLSFR